jgi:plasmid maintenance system killer protein
MLKIKYSSNKLKKILENPRMIKKYYPNEFNNIQIRMTELHAASRLSLISHKPPPRRHKLTGIYDGHWAVAVSKNLRIVFRPIDEKLSDPEDITEIIIVDIIDYH